MDIETDTTDVFASAFDEAAGDNQPIQTPTPVEGEVETPAEPQKPTDAAPEEGAQPEGNVAQPTPAAPATEALPPAAEPQKPAPVAETQPAPQPEVPPGIDPQHLARALAEEQQRIAEANKPAPQPQATRKFTHEDYLDDKGKAALDRFKADWPEEFPAIEQMVNAHAQALVSNQMNELIADINKVLAPITQSLGRSEVNNHWTTIRTAHPDFDGLVEPLKQWVATQPELFRPQMEEIMAKGNAQQVVQLVKMYKDATVQTGAAPATPASSAPQEQQPVVPAAKPPVNPAAVAATAAVPATQRTNQQKGVDPNDFESAFAEAAVALPS